MNGHPSRGRSVVVRRRDGFSLLEVLLASPLLAGLVAMGVGLLTQVAAGMARAVEQMRWQSEVQALAAQIERDMASAGPDNDGEAWYATQGQTVLQLRTVDRSTGARMAVCYWWDPSGVIRRAAQPVCRAAASAAPALGEDPVAYAYGLDPLSIVWLVDVAAVSINPVAAVPEGEAHLLRLVARSRRGASSSVLIPLGFRACHDTGPMTAYGPCN